MSDICENKNNEIICACCKSSLNCTEELYIKISCGHEYHYDCIYDAFIFNKKRAALILECPYCRIPVSHIPEKEGYEFDLTIHRGIINRSDAIWSKTQLGKYYCHYKCGDLYCNKHSTHGKEKKYCYAHRNFEFLGDGYCPIKKGLKYCNICCQDDNKYCVYHSKFENALKCNYVYGKGNKKGQLCGKITIDNNVKCKLHNKCIETNHNKTCIALLKKGKNKGNICGKKTLDETDFCKSHTNLVNDQNITIL
jgi:hypothetical protein